MLEYRITPSSKYKEKERETRAIRRDIATACSIITDGILHYKKKKLHARSRKQIENLSVFDELNNYRSKNDIMDAYGWECISESQMYRLVELWDAREEYINGQGKFSDWVTEMLEQAERNCGEEYMDLLTAFDNMEKQLKEDIA